MKWVVDLQQTKMGRREVREKRKKESASTSSFSFSCGWAYDVFLSFRGKDTRLGFTGNLYNALSVRGIHTFIDDEHLQRGNQIKPTLDKAIQQSKIAILVLSKNYASSSFCLDELVNILHCSNNNGALVLPIFYDVDPSDVRHLRGSYGEALAKHEEKFKGDMDNMKRLEKWKMAVQQVANLSSWHFNFKPGHEYEYKFIGSIVEVVSNKINRPALHVAHHPVGLEFQVLQVNSLLYGCSDDGVRMVGIYGIGGVGKTTVARAVYNFIAHQFEALYFLEDLRENSKKHGLVHLQETLLSEIVGEKDIKLGSVSQGIPIIKHRLQQKKVLLVLDDVDELKQLRATVGWFGFGSKVIITTRDKHLLTSHGVERTYEVKELNKKEALELLNWNAFKTDQVDPSYLDILSRAVTYACGLPLALEVIGSNLSGKTTKEWKFALDQYERIPDKQIQSILKISFDSLKEHEQKLFLDIACFFKGCALAHVKEILYVHHGVYPEYGIGVLVEKSLIKINRYGRLTLHNLIEDMGKEIVRQESPEEPGKRSRLWFHEDIVQVLEGNMELHERAGFLFILPGTRIPEWFEHCSSRPSISFWFPNNFPTISLCLVFGQRNHHPFLPVRFYLKVIKGKSFLIDILDFFLADHIYIFDILQTNGVDEVLLENEWTHVEVSVSPDDINNCLQKEMFPIQIGLHVVKKESCMEDICFTNPYKSDIEITEALRLQIEVQKRLDEQLETSCVAELLLENEWNVVKVSISSDDDDHWLSEEVSVSFDDDDNRFPEEVSVSSDVVKQESYTEDIRFTNPSKSGELNDGLITSE